MPPNHAAGLLRRLTIGLASAWLFAAPATRAAALPKLIPYAAAAGQWGYLASDTQQIAIPARYASAGLFHDGVARVTWPNPHATSERDRVLTNWIDLHGQDVFKTPFAETTRRPMESELMGREVFDVALQDGRAGTIVPSRHEWLDGPASIRSELPDGDVQVLGADAYVVRERHFFENGQRYDAPAGMRIGRVDFKHRLFHVTDSTGRKSGLVRWSGDVIYPPIYGNLTYFPDLGRALAYGPSGKRSTLIGKIKSALPLHAADRWQLLDGAGKVLRTFAAGITATRDGDSDLGTYGHLQYSGAVDPKGFYDLRTGKDVSGCRDYASLVSRNGVCTFQRDLQIGLERVDGSVVVPAHYAAITFFGQDRWLAEAAGSRLKGVIASSGAVVVPLEYQVLRSAGDGLLLASRDGRLYGALGSDGATVIPPEYPAPFKFRDGRAVVHQAGKVGLMDTSGHWVAAPEYDELTDPFEGRTADQRYFTARQGDRWGLLSRDGKVQIQIRYDFVDTLTAWAAAGWFKLQSGQQHAMVNLKTGARTPMVDGDFTVDRGYLALHHTGLDGQTDWSQPWSPAGKPLSPDHFTRLEEHFGYLIVGRGGLNGVLALDGRTLVPLVYPKLEAKSAVLLLAEKDGHPVYVGIDGTEYRPRADPGASARR